jgi:hypothetical protein
VHAELGLDIRAHVRRPAEARRVDDTLDATVPGSRYVDFRTADLTVVGALDRRCQRIHWHGHLAG